jgi:plasmid stability protein
MAGNLHVRNLDDDLIARLKRRAARHSRSAEAEHREILRQALAGRGGTVVRSARRQIAEADKAPGADAVRTSTRRGTRGAVNASLTPASESNG